MLKTCKVILMMTAIVLLLTGCGSSTPDIQEILQNTKENESTESGAGAASDDTEEKTGTEAVETRTAADAQAQDINESVADTAEENAEETICAFVCGEVVSPGVYYFTDGARKADAVEAAGGFTQEANTSYVNLAQLLTDEMQLYIPALGEEAGAAGTAAVTETEAAHEGKINLNTATAAELCQLNGIGESKAQAILQYREENGGFETVDELTQVSGIGESTLEKIRDYIYVE